jgi:hypothetical protein
MDMKRVLLGLILLSLSILLIACNGGYIVPVPLGGGWWSIHYKLPNPHEDKTIEWDTYSTTEEELESITNTTTEEELECLKRTGNSSCKEP